MNNVAILGPGNAIYNNTLKSSAQQLVNGTVLASYFENIWKERNKSLNYSVINQDGQLVGFALLKRDGKTLEVSLIGTKPKRGFGKLLMEQIISNAKNSGINKIVLDSVSDAFLFYHKMGFVLDSANKEHIMMHYDIKRAPKRVASPVASPKRAPPALRRSPRIASKKSSK
jgi:N-acetylglutamate synthase-like GNAT family acetyltransferase